MNQNKSISDPLYFTSGEIAGSLSNLIPFIYIARRGIRNKERIPNCNENRKGLFTLNRRAGEGACPHIGVIVPVNRCKDDNTRHTFEQLHKFLQMDTSGTTENEKREKAEALLLPHFSGTVKIHNRSELSGFVELIPDRALFQHLSKSFEYIDAIRDNPEGLAEPASYSAFKWSSYGEFMEWFYERIESFHWGWEYCYPFFVYDQTCYLGAFRSSRDILERPSLDLGKFFLVAPHIINNFLNVKFTMGCYGWVKLIMASDAQTANISLSNVFPPFKELVEWLKMIDRGDIPVGVSIDEEGTDKAMYVYKTNDTRRILFRVIDPYDSEKVFLEDIFDRKKFVLEFRNALKEFFTNDFDLEKWDKLDHSDSENPVSIKDQILADPWINK